MLSDVVENIVKNVIKPQVLERYETATEAHRQARRETLEALRAAAAQNCEPSEAAFFCSFLAVSEEEEDAMPQEKKEFGLRSV